MASGYPDYEGQKQRVYLTPEWAALNAVDKTFNASGVIAAFGGGINSDYVVPAGKTLYITCLSALLHPQNAADAPLAQHFGLFAFEVGGVGQIFSVGGDGGFAVSLSKPLVVSGGMTFRTTMVNFCNHAVGVYWTALGYEV